MGSTDRLGIYLTHEPGSGRPWHAGPPGLGAQLHLERAQTERGGAPRRGGHLPILMTEVRRRLSGVRLKGDAAALDPAEAPGVLSGRSTGGRVASSPLFPPLITELIGDVNTTMRTGCGLRSASFGSAPFALLEDPA